MNAAVAPHGTGAGGGSLERRLTEGVDGNGEFAGAQPGNSHASGTRVGSAINCGKTIIL